MIHINHSHFSKISVVKHIPMWS